jgi:hypothetical protein
LAVALLEQSAQSELKNGLQPSKEVAMGDKSPKSKQRNKKQKDAAKVRSDEKKQAPKDAQGAAADAKARK